MRLFVTGGTGVIGRHTIPLLEEAGHEVDAPGRLDLDLFDPDAVRAAVTPADAVLHLATRVPPPEARGERESWTENDRLRGEGTPILARAAMDGSAGLFLMPTVAFVYPPGPSDESTPIRDDLPYYLETAVAAEQSGRRFHRPGSPGDRPPLRAPLRPGHRLGRPRRLPSEAPSRSATPPAPSSPPSMLPPAPTTWSPTTSPSPTPSSVKPPAGRLRC